MNKTPNIGLNITPLEQDQIPFKQWRAGLDSDEATSNMMVIDTAIQDVQDTIDEAVESINEKLAELEAKDDYVIYEEKSNSSPRGKLVTMDGVTSYEDILNQPIHIRSNYASGETNVPTAFFQVNDLGYIRLRMPLDAKSEAAYGTDICQIPPRVIYTVVIIKTSGSYEYEAILCSYFPSMASEESYGINKLTDDVSSTDGHTALSPGGAKAAIENAVDSLAEELDSINEELESINDKVDNMDVGPIGYDKLVVYEETAGSSANDRYIEIEGVTSYDEVMGKPIFILSKSASAAGDFDHSIRFKINDLPQVTMTMPMVYRRSFGSNACTIPADVVYTITIFEDEDGHGAMLSSYFPNMATESHYGVTKLTDDINNIDSGLGNYSTIALTPKGAKTAIDAVTPKAYDAVFTFENAQQIGSTSEWTVKVDLTNITADSILWVSPAADCSTEDLALIAEYQISGYENGLNSITFIARNGRPADLTHQFKFQIVRVG